MHDGSKQTGYACASSRAYGYDSKAVWGRGRHPWLLKGNEPKLPATSATRLLVRLGRRRVRTGHGGAHWKRKRAGQKQSAGGIRDFGRSGADDKIRASGYIKVARGSASCDAVKMRSCTTRLMAGYCRRRRCTARRTAPHKTWGGGGGTTIWATQSAIQRCR